MLCGDLHSNFNFCIIAIITSVLRLHPAKDLSLHISMDMDFHGYTDADWSGDLVTSKSTFRYVFITNRVVVA